MRKMVKHLLKKYKYPPEDYDTAISTVISQCEMWTDNMVVWIVWNVVDLCLTIGFLFCKKILENTIIENTSGLWMPLVYMGGMPANIRISSEVRLFCTCRCRRCIISWWTCAKGCGWAQPATLQPAGFANKNLEPKQLMCVRLLSNFCVILYSFWGMCWLYPKNLYTSIR